jgi:hypothetical protein
MARTFDARSLVGRTFGDVLDGITTWSGAWGFSEGGPEGVKSMIDLDDAPSEEERRERAAIRRRLAPIIVVLRGGVIVLIDAQGTVVPLWVWLSGRWTFYRDDRRGVEWLEAASETGQRVRYYNPRFADPAAAATRVAAEPERTGVAGRPTSWHLIGAECRRRYIEKGERYPGLRGESPKLWADVLLAWLRKTHPNHPPPSPKTARNNLSQLLRELGKGEPEIGA